MNQSPTIGKLIAALALAQGEMKPAVKDSENPHYKSKYADLASVWDACRAPLAKHGLAIIQTIAQQGEHIAVTTILGHSDGEWISDTMLLLPRDPSPQAAGSAVTFGRRYALSAMVGVAPDDDDGNAASIGNGAQAQTRAPSAPRREVVKPPAPAAAAPALPAATNGHASPSLDELRAAFKVASDATSRDQAFASLSKTCGKPIASAVDVPPGDYKRAIAALHDLAGVPS